MSGQQTAPEQVGRGVRKAAFRLLTSFFRGPGISIGLALAVWLAFTLDDRKEARKRPTESSQTTSPRWFKRFQPDSKLTIESSEPKRSRYNLVVLGTLRNEGPDSWYRIQLEVQLFGRDAKFVGLCRGYAEAAVRPGQRRYFAVDCGRSEGEPIPDYSTYKIEIVDAQYEMDDGT